MYVLILLFEFQTEMHFLISTFIRTRAVKLIRKYLHQISVGFYTGPGYQCYYYLSLNVWYRHTSLDTLLLCTFYTCGTCVLNKPIHCELGSSFNEGIRWGNPTVSFRGFVRKRWHCRGCFWGGGGGFHRVDALPRRGGRVPVSLRNPYSYVCRDLTRSSWWQRCPADSNLRRWSSRKKGLGAQVGECNTRRSCCLLVLSEENWPQRDACFLCTIRQAFFIPLSRFRWHRNVSPLRTVAIECRWKVCTAEFSRSIIGSLGISFRKILYHIKSKI